MFKYLAIFSMLSISAFASNFNQALLDNADKIIELKKECGAQLSGEVSISPASEKSVAYRFSVKEMGSFGSTLKSCTVLINADYSDVLTDGGLNYSIEYKNNFNKEFK